MTILEQQIRAITADPEHYPQTSRASSESNADWILSHATKLTTEWQRISANVKKGDPNLFWVAETLAFWGLGEARKDPARFITRRDPITDERIQVGEGCICFFRLKPESLHQTEGYLEQIVNDTDSLAGSKFK